MADDRVDRRSVADLRFPSLLLAILGLIIGATPLSLLGFAIGAVGLAFGVICQVRQPSRLTLASVVVGGAAVIVAVAMTVIYLSIFFAPFADFSFSS